MAVCVSSGSEVFAASRVPLSGTELPVGSWELWPRFHSLEDVACGYAHVGVCHADNTVTILGQHCEDEATGILKVPDTGHVACGRHSTFVWNDVGALRGMGCNSKGQLGIMPTSDSQTVRSPTAVQLPVPDARVQLVACGVEHTVVVLQSSETPPRGMSFVRPMEDSDWVGGGSPTAVRWDEDISNMSFTRAISTENGHEKEGGGGTNYDALRHTKHVCLVILACGLMLCSGSWVAHFIHGRRN